ncbi:MAG: GNAT family N-acetyltransferase [Lysobacteraceae bacterium]
MSPTIRTATLDDADAISALVAGLAHHFLEDPDAEAAQPFLATLTPAATAQRIASPDFRHYVAEDESGVCGVIALRGGSHVYHLFVREDRHRRGIARALWTHARALSGHDTFTVRSSLYAEPVYAALGFVREAPPRTDNGVTWVAMRHAGA